MSSAPVDPSQFVGLTADPRLYDEQSNLPETQRFTEVQRETSARGAIVAAGSTLTAISLIGGAVMAVVGVILALLHGIGLLDIALIVVGVVLVSTHWGWVHVAEMTGNAVAARANRGWLASRQAWLSSVEPYSHWSVRTVVLDDGSIRIERIHHRPVRAGKDSFTFASERELAEVHSPDELSATVVERAEGMRRQAALDTRREQERWELASSTYAAALAAGAGEEERRLAQIAASRALSDQINAKLSEPPLIE